MDTDNDRIQNLETALSDTLSRGNAWIVSQGYWRVKHILYDPVVKLQHLLSSPTVTLLDGYLCLSDIAYLVDAYKTSLKWSFIALGTNETNVDLLIDMEEAGLHSGLNVLDSLMYDMSLLFEILGNMECSVILREKYECLTEANEKERRALLPILVPNNRTICTGEQIAFDWMSRYVPQLVLAKKLKYESNLSRTRVITLAHGASSNVHACLEGIKTLCKQGASFDITDFFYFPTMLLNSSRLWSLLDHFKSKVSLFTCNFDAGCANGPPHESSEYDNDYDDLIIPLHIARTSNNYAQMQDIAQNCGTWADPGLCLRFYEQYHRMPTWREYYSLSLPDSQ